MISKTLFLIALLTSFKVNSQTFTISGFIEDKNSGEKLIGATLYDEINKTGTITNAYGFYSLTLPKGEVKLKISYVGQTPNSKVFELTNDITLNIGLEKGVELKELVVNADENNNAVNSTQMSTVDISMETVKTLPVLFGEKDVLKTIQLMPGIQSGTEGTSGIFVRGGSPDQNLMLIDGVPLYNASHLFGIFSVFNPDAINSVKVIKGGFPARYGGRLSSVIDVRMKEGNMNEFHGEGTVGLISSKFTIEGPIKKNTTSFLLSGRRTYADLIARPFMTDDDYGGYFFHDFNAKINHKLSQKDRIYFSSYLGKDKFYSHYSQHDDYDIKTYEDNQKLQWGNIISAFRWNRIISNKLFLNTTLRYSRYKFLIGFDSFRHDNFNGDQTQTELSYFSSIQDWAGAIDFDYVPNPNHYLKFGFSETYHTFKPGINQLVSNQDNLDTTYGSQNQFAHELSLYAEDDYSISERLKVNGGLHLNSFIVNDTSYFSLQPRFSSLYLLNETMSLKASYAKMTQNIHLLSNTSIGLPTDLWLPSTKKVAPQSSSQIALGFVKSFKKGYSINIEGYYKWMNNLIEYKNGASFISGSKDWQEKVEIGKGWSYGAEVLLEKKKGKTTGWIGYTLSWSNRQFENINFGKIFPYRYDRRHDISVVLTHKFETKKDKKGRHKWMDASALWVYGTGNAITLPTDRYMSTSEGGIPYTEVEYIESRNNFRVPAYHRMDFGINWYKQTKRGIRTWSLGIYNVYNRFNAFYLDWGNPEGNFVSPEDDTFDFEDRTLMQYSILPFLPSISYSFKF